MKVLVIDDSKPIFMMVSQMLKELGHEAIWAENGQDGFEKVSANSDLELVLLDWNMPVMDGLEFLKKNGAESFCKAPIVMMTTENKPEKIQEALKNGAIDYIMKPFTADILENKIEMVCD
jgi:two-component system chemotaxis response regulator CheY